MNKILTVILIIAFGAIMLGSALSLPPFGSFKNKDVATWYLLYGLENTGSANIVNSIIWIFRGYDTLGEEIVLFAATLSAFLIARTRKGW
jgi:multicomponent Na+:H+ antiporter subunit B